MKDGKKPLSDKELQDKLASERLNEVELDSALKNLDTVEKAKDDSVKNLIETTLKQQKRQEDKYKEQIQQSQLRHYATLGSFLAIWIAFIFYQNFA